MVSDLNSYRANGFIAIEISRNMRFHITCYVTWEIIVRPSSMPPYKLLDSGCKFKQNRKMMALRNMDRERKKKTDCHDQG